MIDTQVDFSLYSGVPIMLSPFSTYSCDCPTGWKGAFCTETVSICDPEHDPPHQCRRGATCVPLPHGYTCYCPLGTTGVYCEQAFSISDPSFRSHELSWMSFASFHIRKKTHIQLQFRPFSTDGILFYVAQHLKAQSGDFLCISLVNGSVQLRYNLGDRTIVLETLQKVTINGSTWHVIKAGRVGVEGYLDLDGVNVTEKANVQMSYLDTNTDFYIGGVSSLSLVNPMATANGPVGFQGCVREVIINNQELQLTELGAKSGSNVGDCDGTACGTTEREGLIVWMGKAQNEENDFLAIGLHNQSLKIAVNLGEGISVPMTYSNETTTLQASSVQFTAKL
ncbi:protein eyes shut homolog [Molossus nigricans]